VSAMFVSRLHFPVRALGPGKRIGVWLQGCTIRCPGCISADTWRPGTGRTDVDAVLAQMARWASAADGLTVSGGEPLDQPEALAELLRGWRRLSGTSVLLFTGYEWDFAGPWFEANPGLADAVIAGPFEPASGQSLALRGSDNQSLRILSVLGDPLRAYERPRGPGDRQLDAMFDEDGSVWFAGIPGPGEFEQLTAVLEGAGHQVATSLGRAAA
jgi:anaerobic ribonucleoside-triphosphate reductase activating protein